MFGYKRQSWYEQENRKEEQQMADAIVLKLVKEIREELPRASVPKLHFMMQEKLAEHQIKLIKMNNKSPPVGFYKNKNSTCNPV